MPPTLGGKSFVTTRVLVISTGRISSQSISTREVSRRERRHRMPSSTDGRSACFPAGGRSRSGYDAPAWLHDLVTADVEGLSDPLDRRCLLLSPTGSIRADFHVAAVGDSYLLLQAPDQPEPVNAILSLYVLSSDVVVENAPTDR